MKLICGPIKMIDWLIDWRRSFVSRYVFNPFKTPLRRILNKRGISLATDKISSRKTRAKQINIQTQGRQPNVRMIESSDRHSVPKQQKIRNNGGNNVKMQRRLNNDCIFNLRVSRELWLIQFVSHCPSYPLEMCKTASRFVRQRNIKPWPT